MTPYVSSGTAAGFCAPLGKGLAATTWQLAAKLLHSEGAPPPQVLGDAKGRILCHKFIYPNQIVVASKPQCCTCIREVRKESLKSDPPTVPTNKAQHTLRCNSSYPSPVDARRRSQCVYLIGCATSHSRCCCKSQHLVVAVCRASEAAPGLKQVDGKTVVQIFMLDNSVKQLLVENWSTVQVRRRQLQHRCALRGAPPRICAGCCQRGLRENGRARR